MESWIRSLVFNLLPKAQESECMIQGAWWVIEDNDDQEPPLICALKLISGIYGKRNESMDGGKKEGRKQGNRHTIEIRQSIINPFKNSIVSWLFSMCVLNIP